MTARAEKYEAATKAYLRPLEIKNGEIKIICDQIHSFVESDEFELALALLAASNKRIQISGDEDSTGKFMFTANGFCFVSKNLELENRVGISDPEIKRIAEAYHLDYFLQDSSFTDYIFAELDKIADECPKL